MQDLSSANVGCCLGGGQVPPGVPSCHGWDPLLVPHPAWEPHSSAAPSNGHPFPIRECQAPQPPLSTQISCIALSDPMPYMRGTWGTAFLVFFCHLALACSTGSLCTRDSAAQMSQMFANPSSTLPYPEPGALSSTAPGLIGLILITAALQFWSKGALTLMGAP